MSKTTPREVPVPFCHGQIAFECRRFARLRRSLAAAAVFGLLVAAAFGGELTPVETHPYRPYPPIELTCYVFDQPRPIRAWTARVDLTSPDVQFVTTPRGRVGAEFETACATTLQFAEAHDLQLAINASPFAPFRQQPGEGMDIVGLSASDGDVYSPPHSQYGALVFDKTGRADIVSPPFDEQTLATIDDGVGGFHVLVRDGRDLSATVAAVVPSKFADVHPRTAVGLTADHNTLWILIVDGRNPGRSEGMTLAELAEWGLSLGCDDLLNLDGGGSTSLVVQDRASKAWRLINQPVGRGVVDSERLVGNNLGIRIAPTARVPGAASARPESP